MTDIVGKLIFEAEFNSSENSVVFRKEFTDLIKKMLIPSVEEVFDEYSSTTSIVKIVKIDLDLGSIPYPFEDKEIQRILKLQLREKLRFKIHNLQYTNLNVTGDKFTSIEDKGEELILFFLKEGFLPWWSSKEDRRVVSIAELIDKILLNQLQVFISILKKIKSDTSQVIRLISNTDYKCLLSIVSLETGMSSIIIEQTLTDILNWNFDTVKSDLRILYKEFLSYYFLIGKNKIRSGEELKLKFIEYAFKKKRITYSQLIEIFPEHYSPECLVNQCPSYILLFHEYTNTLNRRKSPEKKKHTKTFRELFLNTIFTFNKLKNSTVIIQEVLVHSKLLAQEIRNKEQHTYEKNSKEEEIEYLATIEQIITKYFLYDILEVESKTLGIESIQALTLEWHQKYPERLMAVFSSIPESAFPLLFIRVNENFNQIVASIIYDNYLIKIEKEQNLFRYKEKIVTIFLREGIVPWTELINKNSAATENIIISFYENYPNYFISILKKNKTTKRSCFTRKVKENFSEAFAKFIQKTIPQEELIEKLLVNLPLSVDACVYYLRYYKKFKNLPEEVNFSYVDLENTFVSEFTKESEFYFSFIEKEDEKNKRLLEHKNIYYKTREPIYIMNAGLVLIHSYLIHLFSLCGLIENRKFKDNISGHKAIHLLQYIVNKEESIEEHQLVLNKLLCGIPLSESLCKNILLTEEDKEICEALIKGVVENWPILKKTSNDNFRVSFLQREGLIKIEDSAFTLKVQERGYDVLLDKLPWSIAMIKLPMMYNVMKVYWR